MRPPTSNAYSSAVNTLYWSAIHTLRPSCKAPATSRSLLAGHVSTTLVAARMSHIEATLFRGSGGYVLANVSFTNPSSAGASEGVSRWPSRSSAARVADSPVGICVLAMVPARWSSTRVASAPSSSTRARQIWRVASHASRSSELISHPSLSLSNTARESISTPTEKK